MNVIVDRMVHSDVDEVSSIEKISFSQPWSREAFLRALDDKNYLFFVARDGEQVIAMAGLIISYDEADVTNVAVHPSCRGKGIASILLTKLMEEGEKNGVVAFTLEVRKGNAPAIKLYETLGFVSEGIRPNFYSNPKEDAVIYWKRK